MAKAGPGALSSQVAWPQPLTIGRVQLLGVLATLMQLVIRVVVAQTGRDQQEMPNGAVAVADGSAHFHLVEALALAVAVAVPGLGVAQVLAAPALAGFPGCIRTVMVGFLASLAHLPRQAAQEHQETLLAAMAVVAAAGPIPWEPRVQRAVLGAFPVAVAVAVATATQAQAAMQATVVAAKFGFGTGKGAKK